MNRDAAPASWRTVAMFAGAVALLTALAVIPYVPFASLPHISDDYVQIELARQWGPVSEWPQLAADPLYRCRATSLVLTYWTDRIFGPSSTVFQAQSIVLHVAAALLLAAFGWWKRIGWKLAFATAAFFAVHEGHQEAVVWYAAIPELLVFIFGLLALHCWIRWCESQDGGLAYVAALFFFAIALLSKESAVATVGLMAGVCWWTAVPLRRSMTGLAPFVALSAVYALLIFAAKQNHLHLNDGTFSLEAPVAAVVAASVARLLWIWGLPALAIVWRHRQSHRWLLVVAFFWMVVTLLPYSFLTYMPRVPSRHVYWASAGVSLLVGGAWLIAWSRERTRWAAAAAAVVIVLHNVGWLWVKKYPQYVRRAEPTEAFVRWVQSEDGPVRVKCFPYSAEVAERAARVRLGKSIDAKWDPNAPEGAGVYCDPSRP